MRRLLLDTLPDDGGWVDIGGKDARYLVRVLRLGPGSSFRALGPDGAERLLTIHSASPGAVRCREAAGGEAVRTARSCMTGALDEERRAAASPLPPFALFQALPKGPKMDLVVRQAAEAGVALVAPFLSERTVPRPGGADGEAAGRLERWERIVKEARQQSGSPVATRVLAPLPFEAAVAEWRSFAAAAERPASILLHQDPLAQGSLHGYLSSCPDAVALAVGPEGGFSDDEAARFLALGFKPALVGANVLRAETAALFAIAAAQVILLENSSWTLKTKQPLP